MEILNSRVLMRPRNLARSREFYRDTLGLAISREFGDRSNPAVVFFLGGGLLELSGPAPERPIGAGAGADAGAGAGVAAGAPDVRLWLQVRDLPAEHARLVAAGVTIVSGPRRQPWGLDEMWIADPEGVLIVLVEVPPDHPLRRDARS